MSAEIQVLMWALAAFGAILSVGVVAVITLLWQMKSNQVRSAVQLDEIRQDVNQIWLLQNKAGAERANLEGRVATLELVQARG